MSSCASLQELAPSSSNGPDAQKRRGLFAASAVSRNPGSGSLAVLSTDRSHQDSASRKDSDYRRVLPSADSASGAAEGAGDFRRSGAVRTGSSTSSSPSFFNSSASSLSAFFMSGANKRSQSTASKDSGLGTASSAASTSASVRLPPRIQHIRNSRNNRSGSLYGSARYRGPRASDLDIDKMINTMEKGHKVRLGVRFANVQFIIMISKYGFFNNTKLSGL